MDLPPEAATQPSINAYLDPRFPPAPRKEDIKEDIRNDFEFTILVAVSLHDPFVQAAAAGGPANAKPAPAYVKPVRR